MHITHCRGSERDDVACPKGIESDVLFSSLVFDLPSELVGEEALVGGGGGGGIFSD